jgi:hypothetical protein
MSPARWTETAVEDLVTKVSTERVQAELREVARTSLTDPPGNYGGQLPNGLFWRRGVTAETRQKLEAAERAGETLDDGKEQPWQFVLVYSLKRRTARPDLYVILGVLTDGEILSAYRGDG